CHLPVQLRQQSHGSLQYVVDVDRTVEEIGYGPAFRPTEGFDLRQPVDEHPVALVRRNAPGTGVRLCDVSLVLEGDHVVAHRGTGHTETVPVNDRFGSHGPLVGNVISDDGSQDLEAPFIGTGHHAPPEQSLRIPPAPNRVYVSGIPAGLRRTTLCLRPIGHNTVTLGTNTPHSPACCSDFSRPFSAAFSSRQRSSVLPRRQYPDTDNRSLATPRSLSR